MEVLNAGTPACVVVTENFAGLARAIAASRERPDLPIIVIDENIEHLQPEELLSLADHTVSLILERMLIEDGPR